MLSEAKHLAVRQVRERAVRRDPPAHRQVLRPRKWGLGLATPADMPRNAATLAAAFCPQKLLMPRFDKGTIFRLSMIEESR
jgi:hypothetical protein